MIYPHRVCALWGFATSKKGGENGMDILSNLKYPIKPYKLDDLFNPTSKGFVNAVRNFTHLGRKQKVYRPYCRDPRAVLINCNYDDLIKHYIKT